MYCWLIAIIRPTDDREKVNTSYTESVKNKDSVLYSVLSLLLIMFNIINHVQAVKRRLMLIYPGCSWLLCECGAVLRAIYEGIN